MFYSNTTYFSLSAPSHNHLDERKRHVKTKKNRKTSSQTDESGKCLNSILGDDLILCRLSALLAPLFEGPEDTVCNGKPPLLRKVSSSDIDDSCIDDRSDESLRRGVPVFTLIPGDAAVVLPPILPVAQSNADSETAVQSLLSTVGIEEVEALDPANGGPSAGQCQFACVASALSKSFGLDRPLRDGYRPDLELRSLALHTVRMNPDMYRDFMTVAGGRTRKQNSAGGSSVDINSYLRNMSSPSCDGDAVTLQALCDALKITIRVVKTVDADLYDEERQRERLLGSYSISSTASRVSLGSESSDDEVASSSSAASSVESSLSSSWCNNPYSSLTGLSCIREEGEEDGDDYGSLRYLQRLYVSQEIQPRQLPCVDSRIRDVQNVARGRLIWLSHIGDEVHYRYLRPSALPPLESEAATDEKKSSRLSRPSTCPQGPDPCNEEEARIARFSRMRRHRSLLSSRALQDGYARLYKDEAQTNQRKGFDSAAKASLELRCASEPSLSPRCSLCLGAFVPMGSGGSKSPVSPSCCHHDYCQDCIVSWSGRVGNSCPSCGCAFMSLVDSLSGRIVLSFATDCVTTSGAVFTLDGVVCQGDKTRDDDSSISSCEENGRPDRESEVGLLAARAKARAVRSILSDLDSSYDQAAAGLSSRQQVDCDDDDSAKCLMRDLFSEIAKNRRADVAQIDEILAELLRSLGRRDADMCADELLEAGILRAVRLLLSPSRFSSALRDVAVHVMGSERHLVDSSLFLKSMRILEKITTLCAGEVLTWGKIQANGFDLPKLMLWYVVVSPFDSASHHRAVDRTRQILIRWSKHFSFSLVDAMHQSESKSNPGTKVFSGPKAVRSPKKSDPTVSSTSASVASKRKTQAENPTSDGVATTRAKRARRTISVVDKQAISALLKEEARPRSSVRRAAGKRKVRPVSNFSVEMW